MPFSQTTATKKICSLSKRIRGVAGGTSASKTISILLWLIDYAQSHKGEIISVVSESFPHLKRGSMRDFHAIMEEHHYFDPERWNKTDYIYTFETNTQMEFFSADQPGKVRGPRRDILFINEANNISYETYTQLEIRTRKIVWLDWNPVSEFWFYTDVLPQPDVDFLTLTYKDNEALDEGTIKAIESRQNNKNWWRIYGEGQLGLAEGMIYPNWQIVDEIPRDARLVRYGLDFGYTNDPTSIVGIYKWNGCFVLDELCYATQMANRDIADIFLASERAVVMADSAEPKSIAEIKGYGVPILPSHKGKGSVSQGIQYVQDQKIFVTKRSVNILKEQRNYLWLTDRNGTIINEPPDYLNHMMDAIRYGMQGLRAAETDNRPAPSWYNPKQSYNNPQSFRRAA